MIFIFLKKYFKSIVDALIIAAIIVAFSIWDPWDWFKSETRIKNTPVSLKSVKEIGQLITAEYYGEVIASLKESIIEDFDDEQLKYDVAELFNNILFSIEILKDEDSLNRKKWFRLESLVKQKNIDSKFEGKFNELTSGYLYFPLISFLSDTLKNQNKTKASVEREKYVLWYFFIKDKNELKKIRIDKKDVSKSLLKNFRQHYRYFRADSLTEKKIKKEIIYIGRGWVKAGINFQNFRERNFWYNAENQIIYFRDFEPEILNYDINPWYIPEKRIPGFELVIATGRIKKPLEESKKVKILCKEKLRQQALQSGILTQARENAKESLKQLFSLLMEKPVKNVIFISDKYSNFYYEFAKDSVISEPEAQLIDSIFCKDIFVLDTSWYDNFKIQLNDLKTFAGNLKTIKFSLTGNNFDCYSVIISNTLKDGILTEDDTIALDFLINSKVPDSIEFSNKMKLFKIYCDLNPDFTTVYEFFNNNKLLYNYVGIDTNDLKQKIEYRLSGRNRNEYLDTIVKNVNVYLPEDKNFKDFFWFNSSGEQIRSLKKLLPSIIKIADSISFYPDVSVHCKKTTQRQIDN